MLDGRLVPIGMWRRPCPYGRAGEYAAGNVHRSAACESYALGRRREYSVRNAGPIYNAGPVRNAGPIYNAGPVRYTGSVRNAGPIRYAGHGAACESYALGRAGNSVRADSVLLYLGYMCGERRRIGRNPTYGSRIRSCLRSILVA